MDCSTLWGPVAVKMGFFKGVAQVDLKYGCAGRVRAGRARLASLRGFIINTWQTFFFAMAYYIIAYDLSSHLLTLFIFFRRHFSAPSVYLTAAVLAFIWYDCGK